MKEVHLDPQSMEGIIYNLRVLLTFQVNVLHIFDFCFLHYKYKTLVYKSFGEKLFAILLIKIHLVFPTIKLRAIVSNDYAKPLKSNRPLLVLEFLLLYCTVQTSLIEYHIRA